MKHTCRRLLALAVLVMGLAAFTVSQVGCEENPPPKECSPISSLMCEG